MLNITLDINGHVVQVLHVQRVYPLGVLVTGVKNNNVRCRYKITNQWGLDRGVLVNHRYGDGADRLAAKVLRKFGRKQQ